MELKISHIDDFLRSKKIAIVGVSREKSSFSYKIFSALRNKGFQVFPVNPFTDSLHGVVCFKNVNELPETVSRVLILTPKSETDEVLNQAICKGVRHIWIHRTCETERSLEIAAKHGVSVITGNCILMYAVPVKGIHLAHRFLAKALNQYPQ